MLSLAEFDRISNDTFSWKNSKHRRYHYYLQCDPTLAESVTSLQPPWQAGIVRKVLDGLDRGRGNNPRGHDNNGRRGGRSDRSSDGGSCSEDVEGTTGGKPGNRACRRPAETESAAVGEGAEARDDDPEEDEEGEDKFEASAAPSSAHLAGSIMMRAGQGSEPTRASGGGGGTLVGVDGETEVSPTMSSAATSTDKTAVDVAKRQARQVAAGAGAAAMATAAGMPEIPDRFKAGVESRLGETSDAFQTSIRRAVLNYVLLDAGQRNRLGTRSLVLGFQSSHPHSTAF